MFQVCEVVNMFFHLHYHVTRYYVGRMFHAQNLVLLRRIGVPSFKIDANANVSACAQSILPSSPNESKRRYKIFPNFLLGVNPSGHLTSSSLIVFKFFYSNTRFNCWIVLFQ